MKLDILFVNAGMLLLVFIPYALFILLADTDRRYLKRHFQQLARQYHLDLDIIHSWNNNIIGIDRKTLKLLIVQKCEFVTHRLIDIRVIRRSSILSNFKTIKVKGDKEEVLQWVKLQLETHHGELLIIGLFDSNTAYGQDRELFHAEKLSDTIKSLLVYKPTISSAA